MPETLAQVATACCVSKKTVWSLFEQAASPALTEFSILELPQSGIYWTS